MEVITSHRRCLRCIPRGARTFQACSWVHPLGLEPTAATTLFLPFLSPSLPNIAIGLPKAAKKLQIPAKNCNSLPKIASYQRLTAERREKGKKPFRSRATTFSPPPEDGRSGGPRTEVAQLLIFVKDLSAEQSAGAGAFGGGFWGMARFVDRLHSAQLRW